MKGIFDIKLYKEGLRSLKNFGIISAVLMVFVSVVSVISTISTNLVNLLLDSGESAVSYTNIFEINPFLLLTFIIIAPFMTISVFSFTTSRAASDFYFAIPKRREKVYFSFIMSVVTWIVGILALSFLLPFVISLFFKKVIIINVLASLKYMLDFLLSSLLIISAVTIAISVTGNLFSNVFVSLLIIFVPRIFMIVVTALGVMTTNVVSSMSICAPNLNIPFGYIASMFIYEDVKLGVWPYVYTFLLSVAYFILGAKLFKNRKSEAATKPAATTKLRSIFRATFASAVMLFSSALFLIMYFENDFSPEEVIVTISLFVLSFIAYCVYEIIATKSIKQCVKVMPKFFIPVVVNVLVILTAVLINHSVLSFKPTASEIQYVTIQNDFIESDYVSDHVKKIKLDEGEVKKIISSSLKENLEAFEKTDYFFNTTEEGDFTQYNVKIKTGFLTRERMVYVNRENSEKILEALENKKEFNDLFTTLPNLDDSTLSIMVYCDTISEVTPEYTQKLYNAMLKDIKEGNAKAIDIYKNMVSDFYSVETDISITVNMVKGINDYSINIPITEDFKECYAVYKSMVNEISAKNYTKILNNTEQDKLTVYLDDEYIEIKDYTKFTKMLKNSKVGIISDYPHLIECQLEEYDEEFGTIRETLSAVFSITEEQFIELSENTATYD